MSLQVNDTIDGKYRIVRLLGEGGMGAVYEGENTRIHRRVAIKVLHSGVAQSKDAVERFEREAQAAGRIGSEHIVEVLDLGNLPNGERYMVMEYLEGESLSHRIESRGRLDPHATAELAVQLLEGLRAAHDAAIVHRDLKPENVFILTSRRGHKDFVKIVDFGISKFSAMSGDFSMTRTGTVMGTPYYMAPEQAKGARTVDQRADLYSVGVILYEASTGKVPFDADTFNELLFKIVLENPVAVHERVQGIDQRFSAIVQKAMAKNPSDRYQSAAEFQSELSGYLAGIPFERGATAHAGTPARAIATQLSSEAVGFPAQAPAAPVAPPEEPKKGQTLGTWAHTQDGALAATEIPPKGGPNKNVFAIGGGALLLLAAAGGFFAMSGGGGEHGPEVPAEAAAPVALAPVAPLAPPAVDTPAPPTPKVDAKVAAPVIEPAQAEAEKPSETSAKAPAKEPAPAKSTGVTAASTTKSSSPVATTHPKTQVKSATSEKPASSATPASGRRIRTTL